MSNYIDTSKWTYFKLSDIFIFEKGKCSNSTELNDEIQEVPYVGAKKTSNGVMKWVERDDALISKGNCVIFICQGEGSNGYNLYFDIDSIQTTSNMIGYNEHLNEFNALFLITILDLERPKWYFGRGRAPKLKDTVIKLPSKNNEPDWKYMEEYIKCLKTKEKERILSFLNY
ncbi:restriction endonuclease subunit S [Mycoplasmopsis primatum]|uniref:restriction endonuclease subunit S n=1 Tax=Mycoplasmopsis primatum TaxID=55604 RepID=UPI0004953F27|nr:restriction endonuclease subunit S [Mycoplasmopsis primatum]